MTAAPLRLFAALELPADARARLAAWAAAAVPEGVRPVPEANLHLTLAFLGERPPRDVAACAAAVRGAAHPLGPLSCAGVLWLPPRRPVVLTVAIAPDPALEALQDAVAGALEAALGGWRRDDRPFLPHVTAGRVRRGARVSAVVLSPEPPALVFAPKTVTLFASYAASGGSRHEVLARAPLPRE